MNYLLLFTFLVSLPHTIFANTTTPLQQQVCSTPIKHHLIQLAKQSQYENSQRYSNEGVFSNTQSWLGLIDILEQVSCDRTLSLRQIVSIKNKLTDWRVRNEEHPAIYFYPLLFNPLLNNRNKKPQVAVILPFNKSYEKYTDQLLKLLMRQAKANNWKLNVYDSSHHSIATILDKIKQNGDSCILGPLRKVKIQQLSKQSINIPVLALNTIDKSVMGHNYLFKISVSDDSQAFELKQKLNQLDLHLGLLFYAKDKKSQIKLTEHVIHQTHNSIIEWRQFIPINSKHQDYSPEIKESLFLGQSIKRYNKLNQTLEQEIEFTPRRRQDLDFIAVSTSVHSLKSFYPQLKFWFLEDLPVFALLNEKESLLLQQKNQSSPTYDFSPLDQEYNLQLMKPGWVSSNDNNDFLISKIKQIGMHAFDILKNTKCLKLDTLLTVNEYKKPLWYFNITNKTFYLENSH